MKQTETLYELSDDGQSHEIAQTPHRRTSIFSPEAENDFFRGMDWFIGQTGLGIMFPGPAVLLGLQSGGGLHGFTVRKSRYRIYRELAGSFKKSPPGRSPCRPCSELSPPISVPPAAALSGGVDEDVDGCCVSVRAGGVFGLAVASGVAAVRIGGGDQRDVRGAGGEWVGGVCVTCDRGGLFFIGVEEGFRFLGGLGFAEAFDDLHQPGRLDAGFAGGAGFFERFVGQFFAVGGPVGILRQFA